MLLAPDAQSPGFAGVLLVSMSTESSGCWGDPRMTGEKPAMWQERCKAKFTLKSKVSNEVR